MNTLYDWGVSFSDGSNGGHNRPIHEYLRKATPEEIKLAQVPQITINDYKGEFFDNYVRFGCAEIHKQLFLELYAVKDSTWVNGGREIESITIGKGTFTKKQIKEIAEYYLNK